MKTFRFLSSCRDIKMTIMTSYFRIRDDVIKVFKFHKISTHRIFLPSFSIIWLESEKKFENLALCQALPPLIGYHGNNLLLKYDLYNCLKSHKVSWRSAKPFLRYLAKTLRGYFAPPSPVQIGLSQLRPRQGPIKSQGKAISVKHDWSTL